MRFKKHQPKRNRVGQLQIFKLQLPLTSSEPNPPAMAYNMDRSLAFTVPADEARALVGDRIKSYWYGRIVNGKLDIHGEAPWQTW